MEHEDVSFADADLNQIDFDSLDIGEPEPEPAYEEPEPEPEPVAYHRAPEPPPYPPMPSPERLISGATDASVSQAFNMLAHTVLTNNARTLEDLVKEMLKPMLKVWLDDNLPRSWSGWCAPRSSASPGAGGRGGLPLARG
jgi:cell pole-organizing protein PopZ